MQAQQMPWHKRVPRRPEKQHLVSVQRDVAKHEGRDYQTKNTCTATSMSFSSDKIVEGGNGS